MATHIEGRPSLTRVLAICGVKCEQSQIVKRDPTCEWCARKLEEKETDGRMDRIGRS